MPSSTLSAVRRLLRACVLVASLLPFAAPLAAQSGVVAFGGTDYDQGRAVAVDGTGNAVVTGEFQGTVDFDPGAGTVNLTSAALADVFVARYTPSGAFISAIRFGGTGMDQGRDVAVDGTGNAVVAGFFSGTVDFDPGAGTVNLTSAGDYDVFVARYSPSGALVSAFRVGSTSGDIGYGVAVDGTGNVVVTGSFSGTVDFDPGGGTVNLTSAGSQDVFVARYTPSGALVSAIRVGGLSSDTAYSVAVDASGNAVVTGIFEGTVDFNPGAGTTNLTSVGGSDVFVARYTPSGTLMLANGFGGTGGDRGYAVAVDGLANAFVTGTFSGTVDFDPGAGTFNLTSAGFNDVYVARYSRSGALVWAIGFGGTDLDWGNAVAVDASGNAVVTGFFQGTADFDPGVGMTNLTSGFSDGFVARYTPSGTLVSATRIGGTSIDWGLGVAVDGSDNAVVTGYFGGTVDFDPGAGTTNMSSVGASDVFVTRYTLSGALALVSTAAEDDAVARGYRVSALSPNPSHGAARLTVAVDRSQRITVGVYDVLGRRVTVPFAGMVSPGAAQPIALDVASLPVGVYVVRVEGVTFAQSRTFVVAR